MRAMICPRCGDSLWWFEHENAWGHPYTDNCLYTCDISGREIKVSWCPKCSNTGEMPVGVSRDFDSGMLEADDVEPCDRCQ